MTCIEKLRIEHPDLIKLADELHNRPVGYFGCPHDYGYLPKPVECSLTSLSFCTACWDREIPGTENIKKENDIMPVNAIHTREVTKEDLLKEIKLANEHIHQMETQIKNLERYKQYEDMANEFKAMHTAFMNSGFSDEQAFRMMETLLGSAMPSIMRSVGL